MLIRMLSSCVFLGGYMFGPMKAEVQVRITMRLDEIAKKGQFK